MTTHRAERETSDKRVLETNLDANPHKPEKNEKVRTQIIHVKNIRVNDTVLLFIPAHVAGCPLKRNKKTEP
jgi:hypothetical protein